MLGLVGDLARYAGKETRHFRYKTDDGAVVDEGFRHEGEKKTWCVMTLSFVLKFN